MKDVTTILHLTLANGRRMLNEIFDSVVPLSAGDLMEHRLSRRSCVGRLFVFSD